jgi:hypothetical protein
LDNWCAQCSSALVFVTEMSAMEITCLKEESYLSRGRGILLRVNRCAQCSPQRGREMVREEVVREEDHRTTGDRVYRESMWV